jgi:hypothetical protein
VDRGDESAAQGRYEGGLARLVGRRFEEQIADRPVERFTQRVLEGERVGPVLLEGLVVAGAAGDEEPRQAVDTCVLPR